jgi:hypothetical protein
MNEFKKVATMLGAIMTSDEIEELMREADVVGYTTS